MTIKTKVFKLNRLSKSDIQSITGWLSALRWVWNEGLRLIEELDTFTAPYSEMVEVDGKFKKQYYRAPCCPVPWQYRRIDRNQPWGEGNLAPYTYFARKRPYAQFCPIIPPRLDWSILLSDPVEQKWLEDMGVEPVAGVDVDALLEQVGEDSGWSVSALRMAVKVYRLNLNPENYLHYSWREPRLDHPSNFSLAKYFAHKRHPDKPWLQSVPAWFIRGTCHSLADAWQRYKSGKGGKPRFKRKTDTSDSLIHEDGKVFSVQRVSDRDGQIRIPRLGTFRVKHLWADWGDRPIKVLKIVKRPDAFYLQLTGDLEAEKFRDTELTATLQAPEMVSSVLATIAETGKVLRAYAPDPKLVRRKHLLQQQLSRQTYGGSNWQKTKRKLSQIDLKLAQQAKNYNQKLTTFLNRTYASVDTGSVGKRKVVKKPRKKARAKTIDPIHFDPNGATAIADYNKAITSQRTGQFVALIKQKQKVRGTDAKA